MMQRSHDPHDWYAPAWRLDPAEVAAQRAERRRRLARRVATALVATGLTCLLLALTGFWRVHRAQAHDLEALGSGSVVQSSASSETRRVVRPGDLLGILEIPDHGVRASIRAGVDDRQLDVAAGHVPGTALPGEPGNSVLAAHRDSLFSGLSRIQIGDRIELATGDRNLRFEVADLAIVEPNDLSVLAPSSDTRLTLVTCYPFRYIGPAPQRYIVTAVAVSS